MSLSLPLSSSPLRELFDVAHLAELSSPAGRAKISTLRDVRASASKAIANGARSVNCIYLAADGNLRLIQIGLRGGIKRLWNFGKL